MPARWLRSDAFFVQTAKVEPASSTLHGVVFHRSASSVWSRFDSRPRARYDAARRRALQIRSFRVQPAVNPCDPEIAMRSLVAAFLMLTSSIPSVLLAQGHLGTPQERAACRRDASRFCRQQLNDDFAVQQCLQQNRAKLSQPCQKVFESHGM
jgi:hypothetical protein